MAVTNLIEDIGIPAMVGALIYIGAKLQILNDLKTTTDKIKVNVKVISDHLILTSDGFDHTELQPYSPLKLTEIGKKFISDNNFDKIFADHKKDFFQYIDSENPKLKYDVENAAIKAISILYAKEYMNFLKVYFYNNPKRNLGNTGPTLGVYIRDKYLKEHPEITE